ncbi:hypothetical protein D3C85_1543360 [compost metagenome]
MSNTCSEKDPVVRKAAHNPREAVSKANRMVLSAATPANMMIRLDETHLFIGRPVIE